MSRFGQAVGGLTEVAFDPMVRQFYSQIPDALTYSCHLLQKRIRD